MGQTSSVLLKERLDANAIAYLAPLQELIAIDTHTIGHGVLGGLEYDGQVYLENLLQSLGFSVERLPIDEERIRKAEHDLHEGNGNHDYGHPKPRFNLLAKDAERGSDTVPDVLFNGHVDTMPFHDTSLWKSDPHRPTVRDGKLYGLGAADMKGGLIASIMAVKLLKDCGLYDDGIDPAFLLVADEEGGGNGTLSACLSGQVQAHSCVVAECSDGAIYAAHMGFLVLEVNVKGRALHCGKKWRGENAIEKALPLIDAVSQVERSWLMSCDRHPMLPPPTINLGQLQGGVAASTVPDSCSFKLCAHVLPSMPLTDCLEQITLAIDRQAAADPFLRENPVKIEVVQQGNPFEAPLDHPVIDAARRVTRNVTGAPFKVSGSAAGNDARLMMNIAKIPTIILGPGKLEACHAVDEHIALDDYYRFILIYANLLLERSSQRKENTE